MDTKKSSAFELLDVRIQRWIWQQGWMTLRKAQEEAIPLILTGKNDVIIAASTASGKTEAAFLPILSRILTEPDATHLVIYISPLKALINDQFSRLEQLCESLEIPIHGWHGDISLSKKKKFLSEPEGILLITPESLEAFFVNRGHEVPHLFSRLSYIVIDELHSFIGTERGVQLQSLLNRIIEATGLITPRIGLSATIGDMRLASYFLRDKKPENVNLIVTFQNSKELKLMIHGYQEQRPEQKLLIEPEGDEAPVIDDIYDDLYRAIRGTNNLIFANSRIAVESVSDSLRRLCEERRVPNEFWPHHGNLSKDLREEAEAAIKKNINPVSIVCTTTLEMGIDIGIVNSIVQIGAPPSVASLCQRIGRSGRRDNPSILRIFITEEEVDHKTIPCDSLRTQLIQSIAMVRLLLNKWFEPPELNGLHLSTIIQQIMSLIAERGGVTALDAFRSLCSNGPFLCVDKRLFSELLKTMGEQDLIIQSSDGLLLHGRAGEREVNHYSFYAAFNTEQEYTLKTEDKVLGTLPIDRPLAEKSFLIFGGLRWRILSISHSPKVIELEPAKGGMPPKFGGQPGWIHDKVRKEMFHVLNSNDLPIFIDEKANELLKEARDNFQTYRLPERKIIGHNSNSYIFAWKGDRILDTIAIILKNRGLEAENVGIAVEVVKCGADELWKHICEIAKDSPMEGIELASAVNNKIHEKFDFYLNESLLNANYASSKLDIGGAWETLRGLAN